MRAKCPSSGSNEFYLGAEHHLLILGIDACEVFRPRCAALVLWFIAFAWQRAFGARTSSVKRRFHFGRHIVLVMLCEHFRGLKNTGGVHDAFGDDSLTFSKQVWQNTHIVNGHLANKVGRIERKPAATLSPSAINRILPNFLRRCGFMKSLLAERFDRCPRPSLSLPHCRLLHYRRRPQLRLIAC